MPEFDLIIFDCDGVLVDSEELAMRVLLAAIARQGIIIDPEEAFRDYLGRSLASISASLHDSHGEPLGDVALETMRQELYALYRKELSASPGVRAVLEALRVPFCVASSSHVERIRISLDVTGLLPLFGDRIFSATMVENGKPAPDLFLHAAQAMGVAPDRCLVIEDSPAGIAAARAAGMTVFAYTGGRHIALSGLLPAIEALEPDAIFSGMRTLPALIAGRHALLVGVDVGTGSARAGLFDVAGTLLGRAEVAIGMRRLDAMRAEHDSLQIWAAVCTAVREAIAAAGADPTRVAAIAFDATCSLVLRDNDGQPLAVSDEDRWDTFVWLDHRAMAEAAECTATGHRVLDFAGGVMSPEMEVPKLMWLKRHHPGTWTRLGGAYDLADFLTFMATGSNARSQSTLASKWNFLGHETPGWQQDFLNSVGLDDLITRCNLPPFAIPGGTSVGTLTEDAATALGLTTNCVVAAGLVDAHAGALGVFGDVPADAVHGHLALVAGTSNSILALAAEPRPIHGIWGPYLGAVLPGLWLSEGGQSAAGGLLDHLIRWQGEEPTPELHARIVDRIAELRREGPLAPNLHVLPDFHGNRSPLADPGALGAIVGLTLDSGFDALCRLYWRAAVAIAVGLRQIVETFGAHGFGDGTLHVAGGHTRNPLLMELYADATGCAVAESKSDDPVLLGAAMAAASAAGLYPTLGAAAAAMHQGTIVHQPDASRRPEYDRDYRIMTRMQGERDALRD